MRIGVDCQALQTAASRQRGIGIYTRSVLAKLLEQSADQYHLFFSSALASPDIPPGLADAHTVQYVQPLAASEARATNEYLQRLAYESKELDLLHVASPVEGSDAVIDVSASRRPFALACTLYDLIPLVYPDVYLSHPITRASYMGRLDLYARADVVLAISKHTRADAIRFLGIPADRIVSVGAAVDPVFTRWDCSRHTPDLATAKNKFGIKSPFVLFTGGFDFRKNLEGMLQAFSALPKSLQRQYQLVIVCALQPEEVTALERMAENYGIRSSLVLTNYISQESLILLYNDCALFVFPSLYEGFGLPVLEAMSCGAAIVAGNSSSIPEILGDAGLLVDPADTGATARAMQSALQSRDLRQELAERALQRAKTFSWEATATATRAAFERAHAQWRRATAVRHARKPRIAFFSPLPPQRSGVADYSAELLPHLAEHFDIDVYLDDYQPSPSALVGPTRFYATTQALREHAYFSFVFQMGNSPFHAYMYEVLLEHGGITILHDVCLHNLMHYMLAHTRGNRQRYVEELIYQHGEEARIALEMLARNELDEESLTWLFPMNERVLCSSKAVIVHSQFARNQLLQDKSAELAARVRHIDQGMSLPDVPSLQEKKSLRVLLAVPEDAFVVGSFGIMAEPKQLELGLRAFQRLRVQHENIYYVAVGEFLSPAYEASIKQLCASLGIAGCVVFTGHVSLERFYEYLFACDVALNLRYPSRGETSAAMLRALSCGLPVVVNNLAAFAELPNEAVLKLQPGVNQEDDLLQALRSLASDEHLKVRVGTAARRHILARHSWKTIAAQYAAFIHHVEATRLGDQSELRASLAKLAVNSGRARRARAKQLNQFVDAFAASAGLGRILWV